ncbi:MAG: restriction endonuclease subunit S [Dysgonamonadaceae bacterium]|jgi:restriction endonuclease S subunit|nr:restriction endonuclease subunit S [Dysgonamonadaceae bacterium]
MIAYKKIQDIALVLSGVYFNEIPMGEVNYLQIKDFNKKGEIVAPLVASLELNTRTEKHLLSEGNLLFAAKGLFNFCALYNKDMGKSVASSSFLALKIKDTNEILPEYLCWLLNREDTLSNLQNQAVGSAMPSISKFLMEEYEVPVPSIDVQRKIIAIAGLQKQEQALYKRIAESHKRMIDKQLIEITKTTK